MAMNVKMILPALTEATSPLFRPIKYSLFPPLGLATLAAYLDEDDEVTGTALYSRMRAEGRILHDNWDLYDTRHAVFQPKR